MILKHTNLVGIALMYVCDCSCSQSYSYSYSWLLDSGPDRAVLQPSLCRDVLRLCPPGLSPTTP